MDHQMVFNIASLLFGLAVIVGANIRALRVPVAGCHQHDQGSYEVEGDAVRFGSPREALDRGIATVHREVAVVPLMPVWLNFFLGNEVRTGSSGWTSG